MLYSRIGNRNAEITDLNKIAWDVLENTAFTFENIAFAWKSSTFIQNKGFCVAIFNHCVLSLEFPKIDKIDMAVVEKHTLDGANTISLMRRMHKGRTNEWRLDGYYNTALR